MRLINLVLFIAAGSSYFASRLQIDGIEWSNERREDCKTKFTVLWNSSWRKHTVV